VSTKTKSTLKWQTKGRRGAEAKFRASEGHSEKWPTISISIDHPDCPRYLRLDEEYEAAHDDWCRRWARASIDGTEKPTEDSRPESPDRCRDCDECNPIPNKGWKITSHWPTWYLLSDREIKNLVEEAEVAYEAGGHKGDRPDAYSVDKLAAYGKKWGQTEPYPTLPDNVWVFDNRKEAQAKAEELVKGLDAQIEAWFATIIAAKEAKEAARKAKLKVQEDAAWAKVENYRKILAQLKELVPGLEGSGQWEGIHINNPELLLKALS
jgi:hypothetical protein